MPSPRALFASTEVPGKGGSSTASYDLFHRVQARGYDVHYIELLTDDVAVWAERTLGDAGLNPAQLPNVYSLPVPMVREQKSQALSEFIGTLRPDVMAGFGFSAAQRLKLAAPEIQAVYVTGTCRQAQDYVTAGLARDAIELRRHLAEGLLIPRPVHVGEIRAVNACDLVITHSQLTSDMIGAFFPGDRGKIWPEVISFGDWIRDRASQASHFALPFEKRDIDLLFIASNWSRTEKNYSFVEQLAAQLGDIRIHLIGDVPYPIRNVTHHGFIGVRDRVFELMGRSRCVACPSLIDAAPGILFEAVALGANVVATPNCGNADLCHADLLVPVLAADAFAAGVRRASVRPYPIAPAQRTWQALDRLMAILGVLARPIGGQKAA